MKNEPVLSANVIAAIVGLLGAFGLHLTAEQVMAVMTVVLLIVSLIARSKVTPTSKL